jgi:hypothetical protein
MMTTAVVVSMPFYFFPEDFETDGISFGGGGEKSNVDE